MKYILALDQGTTSSRAALVSEEGKIVCILNREFPQLYPREGWVEHDPTDIWGSQYGIMMEVLAKSGVGAEEIAAIGITNQRETAIVWEKATGKPVYNAIVWQCRRTAERIEEIVKSGAGEMIRKKTGLIPDAYFSASKAEWILDRADPKRERAKRGELLFGTVDSYLVWKLTGGKVHATDRTNAARTMLFNIHTLDWDDELLELFHIPREMLPEVKSSGELYGYAPVGGVEIPVFGVAGDQQSALFGQCCFQAGEAKNTYGTGCFLLMNTGETPAESKNGLLTTVAATERRAGAIRAGGQRVYRRRGDSVAARRNAIFRRKQGRGILCGQSARYGRRVSGAGVYGHGRAVLGYVRPRRAGGHYARHAARTYYPRGAGIHCVSVGGADFSHGKRHGNDVKKPESGRRRFAG